MKILVLEKPLPRASAKVFEPFLREEAARVWSLCQEGVIREIYSTLPLVRENLVAFDVVPLMPYSGFERLFTVSDAS
jgi:hypothetical protein